MDGPLVLIHGAGLKLDALRDERNICEFVNVNNLNFQ
jgi:hypothetical protein